MIRRQPTAQQVSLVYSNLSQAWRLSSVAICVLHMVVLKIGEAQYTNINISNDSALINEPSLWELALHILTDLMCINRPTSATCIAKCDSTTCGPDSLQGSVDFRPHRWKHCGCKQNVSTVQSSSLNELWRQQDTKKRFHYVYWFGTNEEGLFILVSCLKYWKWPNTNAFFSPKM